MENTQEVVSFTRPNTNKPKLRELHFGVEGKPKKKTSEFDSTQETIGVHDVLCTKCTDKKIDDGGSESWHCT